MLDVTIRAPEESTAAAPQRRSLLDAAVRMAAVMRYPSLSYAGTADRLAGYEGQPYPLTYVFSSDVVVEFLRALGATQQALADGASPLEAGNLPPRPTYGPRLREAL